MNAPDRWCFRLCTSCARCSDRGTRAKCVGCNGRNDPYRERPPHPDDYCRCSEGILQIRHKSGRIIQRRFESNPFKANVQTDAETQDERDWNQFLNEKREILDDPTWNPIQVRRDK